MTNSQQYVCKKYREKKNVLNGTPRQETCSDRCPPPQIAQQVNDESINPMRSLRTLTL